MSTFDDIFNYVIGIERGYSNNPADPGGETMYGITFRVARKYGYTGPMQDLPLPTAKDIAKQEYWNRYYCDQFDPIIGLQVFDAAYNGGKPIAWLQTAVGAEADGIMGPVSLAAIKSADPLKVIMKFLAYRLQYLGNLPTWSTFGHGWSNRIASNLIRGAQ